MRNTHTIEVQLQRSVEVLCTIQYMQCNEGALGWWNATCFVLLKKDRRAEASRLRYIVQVQGAKGYGGIDPKGMLCVSTKSRFLWYERAKKRSCGRSKAKALVNA